MPPPREMHVKLASIIVWACLFCTASSAAADTTAVYAARTKSFPLRMTVEIADNGNVRYQMSAGRTYGLVLGGVDYFVELGAKGPIVDRAEDLLTAQKEAMAAFMPALDLEPHDGPTDPQLVRTGTVTINGRTGEAFAYKRDKTGATTKSVVLLNPHPEDAPIGTVTTKHMTQAELDKAIATAVIVISHDPDLAQLGKAMAKQLGTSRMMLTRMLGQAPGMVTEVEKLLQSGAPLSFAGMALESVNHTPIDPKRFELPAEPETLDQIRERMKPLPPPPTATPSKP